MSAARPPLSVANRGRLIAARTRGEWLIAVREGLVTATQVIAEAQKPGNEPLLRIRLRQLLEEQPGFSSRRARLVLAHVGEILDTTLDGYTTIQWLIDQKSGGRRLMAFADALNPKNTPPWPGFPYTPSNSTGGHSHAVS